MPVLDLGETRAGVGSLASDARVGSATASHPVPVLYVAGWGRSGSTLLSYILADLPGFVAVGELRYLWSAISNGELCGCGEPVTACPFWKDVGQRAFGGWEQRDVREMVELDRMLFARPRVALLAAPRLSRRYHQGLERYLERIDPLYSAIEAATGGYVVDSSKDPPYGFALRRAPGLQLSFVHLVRDSRAVAFAWGKDLVRPEVVRGRAYFQKYRALHASALWLGGNLVLHLLPRELMRYEQLASTPRTELERLLAALRVEADPRDLSALDRGEVRLGGQHTIRGNPIRFHQGRTEIRIDEQWRRDMPPVRRALVTMLTWPLLVRYGYLGRRAEASARPSVEIAPPDEARGSEPRGPREADLAWMGRGGLLNLVGAVCLGVGSFAFAVLVARGLGARSAGALFEVIGLFVILATVAQLGTSVGIVRALSRARALGRTGDLRPTVAIALVPVLFVGVLAGATVFLLAPQIASLTIHGAHHADAVTYLRVLAPALPLAAALMTILPATQGLGTMLPTNALESIGQPLARVGLAALLFTGVATPAYAPLIWALPVGVAFCCGLVWLRRLLTRADPAGWSNERTAPLGTLAADFWRFTSVRFLAATLQIALVWLDVVLVGAFRSAREAAVYTAASRYIMAGTILNGAIIAVLQPLAGAHLALGENGRLRAAYQTATGWLIAVAFPIYLVMASFAPVLIRAFGPQYTSGSDALVILSLAMLLSVAVGPVMVLVLMGGRSVWNLLDTLGALILNVALNVLLIPRLGITGAAIAWAASIALLNVAPLLQVARWWGINPAGPGFNRVLLAALACFGAIPFAVGELAGRSVPTLVAAVALALPPYLALLWRWRVRLGLDMVAGTLMSRLSGNAAGPGEVPAEQLS
jgi:O-antigen/teichoic acid export membrane protein